VIRGLDDPPKRGARLKDVGSLSTSLDFARFPWYSQHMIKRSRTVNRNHMTRFSWAVGGVVR
jgi:hypothetical protein